MYCPHCMAENRDGDTLCRKCGKNLHEQNGEHELPVGSVLSGRYYVGKTLRQGGFGITYVGMDQKAGLQKKIAIKEFFPSGIATRMSRYSEDVSVTGQDKAYFYDKEKAKFLEEARILAMFSDVRNVVSVTDIVSEHNTVYMIMEFLEGMDLDEYIHRKTRLSFQESYTLLKPIILSLGRIHNEGLIHRDISPSNIKILRDGSAVLLDFGAAREFDATDEKSLSIILKPGYAPLEQYTSRGQGKSTDVYALCATIYKMITGITPENSLDRAGVTDVLKRPIETGALISPSQEAVLLKGMAVQAADRIQSMEELYNAFAAAENDGTARVDSEGVTVPVNDNILGTNYSEFETIPLSPSVQDDPNKTTPANRVKEDVTEHYSDENVVKTKKWMPIAAAVIAVVIGVGIFLLTVNRKTETPEDKEPASTVSSSNSGGNETAGEGDQTSASQSDEIDEVQDEKGSQEDYTTDGEIEGELSINVIDTIVVGDDVGCSLKLGNLLLYKETEGISWSSSDKNVIRVNGGVITGVSEGSAYIYADYKGKNASTRITVLSVDSAYGSSISVSTDDVRLSSAAIGNTTSTSVYVNLVDPPSEYQLYSYKSSGLSDLQTEWKKADDGSPILVLQPGMMGEEGYITIYLTPTSDRTHIIACTRVSVKVTAN